MKSQSLHSCRYVQHTITPIDWVHAACSWLCSPLELCWVLAQAEGVKAVVSGQRAIQVGGELAAREPAGAAGRGGLQRHSSSTAGYGVRYCSAGDSCRVQV